MKATSTGKRKRKSGEGKTARNNHKPDDSKKNTSKPMYHRLTGDKEVDEQNRRIVEELSLFLNTKNKIPEVDVTPKVDTSRNTTISAENLVPSLDDYYYYYYNSNGRVMNEYTYTYSECDMYTHDDSEWPDWPILPSSDGRGIIETSHISMGTTSPDISTHKTDKILETYRSGQISPKTSARKFSSFMSPRSKKGSSVVTPKPSRNSLPELEVLIEEERLGKVVNYIKTTSSESYLDSEGTIPVFTDSSLSKSSGSFKDYSSHQQPYNHAKENNTTRSTENRVFNDRYKQMSSSESIVVKDRILSNTPRGPVMHPDRQNKKVNQNVKAHESITSAVFGSSSSCVKSSQLAVRDRGTAKCTKQVITKKRVEEISTQHQLHHETSALEEQNKRMTGGRNDKEKTTNVTNKDTSSNSISLDVDNEFYSVLTVRDPKEKRSTSTISTLNRRLSLSVDLPQRRGRKQSSNGTSSIEKGQRNHGHQKDRKKINPSSILLKSISTSQFSNPIFEGSIAVSKGNAKKRGNIDKRKSSSTTSSTYSMENYEPNLPEGSPWSSAILHMEQNNGRTTSRSTSELKERRIFDKDYSSSTQLIMTGAEQRFQEILDYQEGVLTKPFSSRTSTISSSESSPNLISHSHSGKIDKSREKFKSLSSSPSSINKGDAVSDTSSSSSSTSRRTDRKFVTSSTRRTSSDTTRIVEKTPFSPSLSVLSSDTDSPKYRSGTNSRSNPIFFSPEHTSSSSGFVVKAKNIPVLRSSSKSSGSINVIEIHNESSSSRTYTVEDSFIPYTEGDTLSSDDTVKWRQTDTKHSSSVILDGSTDYSTKVSFNGHSEPSSQFTSNKKCPTESTDYVSEKYFATSSTDFSNTAPLFPDGSDSVTFYSNSRYSDPLFKNLSSSSNNSSVFIKATGDLSSSCSDTTSRSEKYFATSSTDFSNTAPLFTDGTDSVTFYSNSRYSDPLFKNLSSSSSSSDTTIQSEKLSSVSVPSASSWMSLVQQTESVTSSSSTVVIPKGVEENPYFKYSHFTYKKKSDGTRGNMKGFAEVKGFLKDHGVFALRILAGYELDTPNGYFVDTIYASLHIQELTEDVKVTNLLLDPKNTTFTGAPIYRCKIYPKSEERSFDEKQLPDSDEIVKNNDSIVMNILATIYRLQDKVEQNDDDNKTKSQSCSINDEFHSSDDTLQVSDSDIIEVVFDEQAVDDQFLINFIRTLDRIREPSMEIIPDYLFNDKGIQDRNSRKIVPNVGPFGNGLVVQNNTPRAPIFKPNLLPISEERDKPNFSYEDADSVQRERNNSIIDVRAPISNRPDKDTTRRYFEDLQMRTRNNPYANKRVLKSGGVYTPRTPQPNDTMIYGK